MLLGKLFLNLSMFLLSTNSNYEFVDKIGSIHVLHCTFVLNCISQTPTPTPTPTPPSNGKKCRDGNEKYPEGTIIERHGVKLVCKNKKFVPLES